MSTLNAISGQLRAIADHVLKVDYSGAELREIAVEMADTRAIIEAEILRLDGKTQRGRRAVRTLLMGTPPDGSAA